MSALTRVTYEGHTLNQRTVDMVKEAEKILGHRLTITQGSYNRSVGASAGTHDGGGVLDVAPHPFPLKIVTALREVGFASWHRMPSQGPWPEHIHSVAIGDKELSHAAAAQVVAYKNGRNGLANNAPDDGPRVPIRTWEQWRPHDWGKPLTLHLHQLKGPAHTHWTKVAQRRMGVPVNGVFDRAMRRHVIAWRKANHLGRPYGWIGRKAWAHLRS